MTILWEALPLATLTGTTVFCAWKWQSTAQRYDSCNRQRIRWNERWEEVRRALVEKQSAASYYSGRAIDAEDRLRRIELDRHRRAKHARAIQLQRQREQRDATTIRLKEGR